jgi:hypothetical protein
MTYDLGNPDPGVGQSQKCGGIRPANRIRILQGLFHSHDVVLFNTYDCSLVIYVTITNYKATFCVENFEETKEKSKAVNLRTEYC